METSRRLAELTPGFSSADIKNIVNESAIVAVRRGKEAVDDLDFEEAIERVIAGTERVGEGFVEQEKTVAFHEAGHAVIGSILRGGSKLVKVTIKPRSKGALGFA